jgi:hypothetical protein
MSICRYVATLGVLFACLALAGCIFPKNPWAQGTGVSGGANLTVNQTTAAIYFNASTHVAKNVSAINQTNTTGVFSLYNNKTGNISVNMSVNQSFNGTTIACGPFYNMSGKTNLTNVTRTIFNMTNNSSTFVWCWADFYFPVNKTRIFNITVVQG